MAAQLIHTKPEMYSLSEDEEVTHRIETLHELIYSQPRTVLRTALAMAGVAREDTGIEPTITGDETDEIQSEAADDARQLLESSAAANDQRFTAFDGESDDAIFKHPQVIAKVSDFRAKRGRAEETVLKDRLTYLRIALFAGRVAAWQQHNAETTQLREAG